MLVIGVWPNSSNWHSAQAERPATEQRRLAGIDPELSLYKPPSLSRLALQEQPRHLHMTSFSRFAQGAPPRVVSRLHVHLPGQGPGAGRRVPTFLFLGFLFLAVFASTSRA